MEPTVDTAAVSPEARHWLGDGTPGDQTLVFADMVDSTSHLIRLGDAAWSTLLDALDAVRDDLACRHGGRTVNVAGDGALITFPSTDSAVSFCEAWHIACRLSGIEIRSGIHRSVVQHRANGDLAGLGVHLAARLQATAEPGQILVSDRAACASSRPFTPRGMFLLKGIPAQVEAFEPESPVGLGSSPESRPSHQRCNL